VLVKFLVAAGGVCECFVFFFARQRKAKKKDRRTDD